MEVLPLRTHPPRIPTRQRHNPPQASWQGGYQKYSPCLRWDFGFTCAFCLLHEADFALHGVSGLGTFTAEHFEPQSIDTQKVKVNAYANLVYACRLCNRARSAAPGAAQSRRLLDPTRDNWDSHFQLEGDSLLPRTGDMDASYTWEVYDLDDRRKVEKRKGRYDLLSCSIDLLKTGPAFHKELIDLAEQNPQKELIEKARTLDTAIRQAYLIIKHYSAIPADAPVQCRCGTTDMHSLPEEFARQAVQI